MLAIDKEDVESRIITRLSKEEQKKFKFSNQKFESIKLEKNNLVVANFSLPYCNKNNFKEVEKDGTTALGKEKHWHIFNIIAKK